LDIPQAELDEAIAIAMTVGATKVRALADKIREPREGGIQPSAESGTDCKT